MGNVVNPGHRDVLHLRRHHDEDTFKAPAEGTGPLLATAHCVTGKGRLIPRAGTAGPEQSGTG